MAGILLPSTIPLITGAVTYGAPVIIAGAVGYGAFSLYQKYSQAKQTKGLNFENLVTPDAVLLPDVAVVAEPIILSRPRLDFSGLVDKPLEASTPVRVQELTTAQKIAILAPKLFFSGLGWLLGNAIAPGIGAGFGDAVGTFVGCLFSLGFEIAFMKYNNDPKIDSNDKLKDFVKLRLVQAGMLSIASLFAGWAFGPMSEAWKNMIHPNSIGCNLLVALLTGFETALIFGMVQGIMRMPFSHEEIQCDKKNLKDDAKLAAGIIFPAQTAFALSGINAFDTFKDPLLAGAAVLIGGVVGYCLKSIFEKIMEQLNKKRNITRSEEFEKSVHRAELLRVASISRRAIAA